MFKSEISRGGSGDSRKRGILKSIVGKKKTPYRPLPLHQRPVTPRPGPKRPLPVMPMMPKKPLRPMPTPEEIKDQYRPFPQRPVTPRPGPKRPLPVMPGSKFTPDVMKKLLTLKKKKLGKKNEQL